jgi:hypothetical protein
MTADIAGTAGNKYSLCHFKMILTRIRQR